MKQIFLKFAVILLFGYHVHGCGRGSITIANNGYRQVLIAIHENVPENEDLIDKIQEVFTKASAFLFTVTRRRAYFDEINILIPDSWSDKPEYSNAGRETYDKSDIVIEDPDIRFDYGDRPFVLRGTPCGYFGQYMHLTPKYLLDESIAAEYGPYEKVLVHEWAHLRYGVFDEYPTDQYFYAEDDGNFEATRCSKSIKGVMYNADTSEESCNFDNNLPDPDCRFRDEPNLDGRFGSLMYRHHLEYVLEFCDNDTGIPDTLHNPLAPNLQNRMCRNKSVWEVLRAHEDFHDTNPPREIEDTTPSFKLFRHRFGYTRVVLVLDVSGSMAGARLMKLRQGCSNYISFVVRDGDKVGIVEFSSTATALINITEINNNSRAELLDYIPNRAIGATSIGSGIREGIQMLQRDPDGTLGGSLIVVSDGQENTRPFISDVIEETIEAGVTVHSIAFTNDADSHLDALAIMTGGLPFLYSENDNSNALNEAFKTIGELKSRPGDQKYTIVSEAFQLSHRGAALDDQIILDSGLGRETEFIFDYSGSGIKVNLTSPSGRVYDETSENADKNPVFGIFSIVLPGIAESGSWSYSVISQDSVKQNVAVSVLSKSSNPNETPIIAQAFWGQRQITDVSPGPDPVRQSLHASVSQGYAAVLNSQVLAVVERPDGSNVLLALLDNGAGADVSKDDGVYSAFFLDFNEQGRYGVKVTVNSSDVTMVSPRRIVGRSSAASRSKRQEESDVPAGLFQRVAAGGSFELEQFTAGPGGKIYPPGRVIDLMVTAVSYENQTVSLQWTAVGAELDKGRASSYELRMSKRSVDILTNFADQTLVTDDIVISGGKLSSTRPANKIEEFVIEVPTKGDVTYSFGVVVRDEVERNVTGQLSNIATASLKPQTPPKRDKSYALLIVGIVAGVAFITLIVLAIVLVKRKGSKSRNYKPEAYINEGF